MDIVQINLRLDVELASKFRAACESTGKSYADVLRPMIEAWLAEKESSATRHLDGSECPLSELIRGIGDVVRERYAR